VCFFANRDNYGFITFRHANDAFCAIESELNSALFCNVSNVCNL